MGNKLSLSLVSKFSNNHHSLNVYSEFSGVLLLNEELYFLFLFKNLLLNLGFYIHSIFLKRFQNSIYIYAYFYNSRSIVGNTKYLSQFINPKFSRKLFVKQRKKSRFFFSKFLKKKLNFFSVYLYLLTFSSLFFNTFKTFLFLNNLNTFFYSKKKKFLKSIKNFSTMRPKKNIFLKKRLKRSRKKKYFAVKNLDSNLFLSNDFSKNLKFFNFKKYFFSEKKKLLAKSRPVVQKRIFWRKKIKSQRIVTWQTKRLDYILKRPFLPRYLKNFNFIFGTSLFFQSAQILGNFLRSLLELNFHKQKGRRIWRVYFFMKRFFFNFISLSIRKKFFFRCFSFFLNLKGKFRKDGRKRKRLLSFHKNLKQQKINSLTDYYSSDIFTRFGVLRFSLFLRGQKIHYIFKNNFNFNSIFFCYSLNYSFSFTQSVYFFFLNFLKNFFIFSFFYFYFFSNKKIFLC